jgi:hypothetical protein
MSYVSFPDWVCAAPEPIDLSVAPRLTGADRFVSKVGHVAPQGTVAPVIKPLR